MLCDSCTSQSWGQPQKLTHHRTNNPLGPSGRRASHSCPSPARQPSLRPTTPSVWVLGVYLMKTCFTIWPYAFGDCRCPEVGVALRPPGLAPEGDVPFPRLARKVNHQWEGTRGRRGKGDKKGILTRRQGICMKGNKGTCWNCRLAWMVYLQPSDAGEQRAAFLAFNLQ